MRKLLILILTNLLFCVETIFPSIALVLSGGGAKGVAQIPTIQLLDSLNIPIDFVVGTSIGSISGGMYSIGYSPEEIKEAFFNADWELLVSNKKNRKKLNYFKKNNYQKYQLSFTLHNFTPKAPIALSNGHESFININQLIRHNELIYNFDDFVIPFRCNATDLISGDEIVFSKGSLSKSLRCSSSIPTVFNPIENNNQLLVDGGVLNNLGTDIAKDLGADIIIAVDVSSFPKKSEDIIDIFDVLSQSIQLNAVKKKNDNKKLVDILIEPKVSQKNTLNFDFQSASEMYRRGYIAAYQNLESLIKIKESLPPNKISSSKKLSSIPTDTLLIETVIINSKSKINIIDLFNYNFPKKLSKGDIIKHILNIRHSNNYNNISFEFIENTTGFDLMISLEKNNLTIINDVFIKGNNKISNAYIRNILDMTNGDHLNYEKLDQKISQLYNLDFFESISYELINFNHDHVDIVFNIKESEFKRVNLGAAWSSYYKMIAKLKLDLIYKPIDRFRFQDELLIGNSIQENKLSLLYTGKYIRQLPIMPILRYDYKKSDLPIYNINSNIIEQNIRSEHKIFGFLIPFQNIGFLELDINKQTIEYQNSLNEKFDFYSAVFIIDQLNDLLYPTEGIALNYYYEKSSNPISDFYYNNLSLDKYISILNRSSIRLYGDYINSKNLNSNYKNIHYFKPDRALAYSEYDIFSSNILTYGVELNYLYKNSQTIRFLFNTIDKIKFAHNSEKFENYNSYGVGLRIKSILGPINFLWTKANKGFFNSNKIENYYFSIGIDY